MGQYGSYGKELVLNMANDDTAKATAIALEAVAGVKSTWTILEPITVTRFGIRPTVAFNYDTLVTKAVLKLKKYITPGSATGEVELASITLEDAWAVGHVYYVDVSNLGGKADIKCGEQLVAEVTTQGAGGTEVGDYEIYIAGNPRAEVAANQSYMHNVTP